MPFLLVPQEVYSAYDGNDHLNSDWMYVYPEVVYSNPNRLDRGQTKYLNRIEKDKDCWPGLEVHLQVSTIKPFQVY